MNFLNEKFSNSFSFSSLFQYYEMSYGLNVEMHKQVSLLFFSINCDECLNNKGYKGEILRDVLIHVGIKLNFHFRIANHFHGLAMFATYTQKMQTFFSAMLASSFVIDRYSLASVYTLNDSRHKKKAKCKFFELGIENRRGRVEKKLKILFYPNFVFLFIFPIQFLTLLSIRMRKEKCAFSVST